MQVPRLHPHTIEQIKEKVDIVEVISPHVVLRKRGRDYVGLCPFHDEKSPSFSVSPSKQMYHCFGCGAGGNAIKFLMEIGKRSFGDVVLDLARQNHIPIQTLEPEKRQELQRQITLREQLLEIMAIAANFYQHSLWQNQQNPAFEYLEKKRRLDQPTIQQFILGYAPPGWETIYSYLVEQKKFPVQLVEQSGLIVPRKTGSGYYDRFRDRLMIPIANSQGQIIGFGGRTLANEEPKYLNSPETELFDKGKTLFALDKAKNAIAKKDIAIVVEGYFDAIALHAAGITNVVASLGTALSIYQVKMLLRYNESKQIIFNFDADAAGVKATERAIGEIANLAYQGHVQLKILNLPEGKDPDEFLQNHGVNDYQKLIDNAPFWIDWQIQQILLKKDLKKADQNQQVTQALVALLSKISDSNQRTHYLQTTAEILSQGDARLIPMMGQNLEYQIRRQRRQQQQQVGPKTLSPSLANPADQRLLEHAEAMLLRICIHCPEYQKEVVNSLKETNLTFSFSHHRFLWQVLLYLENQQVEHEQLISALQNFYLNYPEQMQRIGHLFNLEETTKGQILRIPLVIRGAIACLERVSCERRYRYFRDLWQKTSVENDPKMAQNYYEKFSQEKKRMIELDDIIRITTFNDLITLPWIDR